MSMTLRRVILVFFTFAVISGSVILAQGVPAPVTQPPDKDCDCNQYNQPGFEPKPHRHPYTSPPFDEGVLVGKVEGTDTYYLKDQPHMVSANATKVVTATALIGHNCFGHAMGMTGRVGAPVFEQWLAAKYRKRGPTECPAVGDLLVYTLNGAVVHVAVVMEVNPETCVITKVRSKWGSEGSIYEHTPEPVPAQFGSPGGVYTPL